MVRRSTWILLAIFVLLVAVAVLWPRLKKSDDTPEPTATTQPSQPKVYDVNLEDVIWIQFMDAQGKLVEVERESPTAEWVLVGETLETSDSFRIASVAGQLLAMQAMRTFETDLGIGTVGIDHPGYTITIRTTTGKEIINKIGNLNAVGNGYYIKVDNEPVVIVAKLVLDEVLGILTEPPLAATPTPEATDTVLPELELTPTP